MNALPTKEEIATQLRDLIEGRKTREEASAWASSFVCRDHPRVTDWTAWEALKTLGGADLQVDLDGRYLYHENDFRKWLDDLLGNPSG